MKRCTIHDALQIGEILSRVAQAELMPRFGRLIADQVRQKSSRFDVVTDADEAAEQAIAAELKSAYPAATIIGEEAAERDRTLLHRIGTADLAFILDPIDGAKNCASGLPLFGVMLAATVRGEVVLGAIHDPVRRDTAFAQGRRGVDAG